MEILCISRLQ